MEKKWSSYMCIKLKRFYFDTVEEANLKQERHQKSSKLIQLKTS